MGRVLLPLLALVVVSVSFLLWINGEIRVSVTIEDKRRDIVSDREKESGVGVDRGDSMADRDTSVLRLSEEKQALAPGKDDREAGPQPQMPLKKNDKSKKMKNGKVVPPHSAQKASAEQTETYSSVSKETFCRLADPVSELSGRDGNSVTVQVVDADPDAEYSVLVESFQRFVSSGTRFDRRIVEDRTNEETREVLLLEFDASFLGPGDFSIRVHEIKKKKKHQQKEVVGSPLSVKMNDIKPPLLKDRPKCQSLSTDALTSWEGNWIGPNGKKFVSMPETMRTGWAFLPNDCILELFSKEEIMSARSSKQLQTIIILGHSMQRGIFLSLVDIALATQEKGAIGADTPIEKCWGRMSVQVGNLKFIYQDMRTPKSKIKDAIVCHKDKVAVFPDLFSNATKMVRKLFDAKNVESWPSTILLGSECHSNEIAKAEPFRTKDDLCVRMIRQWLAVIPKNWDGTFYVTDSMFNGGKRAPYRDEYTRYTEALKELNAAVGDKRVRFLDTVGLSTAMRLWTQSAGEIWKAQHFHAACDGYDGIEDIRVRSNVTEALAHLLLGRTLAPNGKDDWLRSRPKLKPLEEMPLPEVCLDCPKELLPFHIKPDPDFTCHSGSLAEVSNQSIPFHSDWSNVPCPASCMETKPTDRLETQTGFVEVRSCKVLGQQSILDEPEA